MRPSWLTCLLILTVSPPIRGQTLVSQVSPGRVELGVFRQSFHRSVRYDSGVSQAIGWDRVALLARVGLGNVVVLEIEGLAWHRGATDTFPSRDYFDFTFGAGASVTPWRRGRNGFALTVHYHEHANLDQSTSRYSKRTQQFLLAAVLGRSLTVVQERADLWVGPALVVDRAFQYPKFYPSDRGISVHNLGVIMGAALLVGGRASIFGQLTYANYWQGQGGVSVVL